jgi:CAAX prenyl protease-like protein
VIAGAAALLLVRRRLPASRLGAAPVLVPVLIGALACLLWIAVLPAGDAAPLAGALAGLPTAGRVAWVGSRLAGSILVVPLVEELAFRGFLLPWLVSPDFEASDPRAWTPAAVGLSSLAFGALHVNWVAGALAGLVFAAAKLWRGRLADAVLAHAACNAGLAAAALLGGRLDLWS